MVCPSGLGFSAGAQLPGSVSLGLIGSKSMRCLFTNEEVRPKSEGKAPFIKNYAIMPSLKGSGLKNRNLGGIFPGQRGPKNDFLPYWPSKGHNLRRYPGYFSWRQSQASKPLPGGILLPFQPTILGTANV
jgi:hypothetical protein